MGVCDKSRRKIPNLTTRYTNGKLLDQTEYSILIDTGASKSCVKIILHEMQITPCPSKVCPNYSKSSDRQWTKCSGNICDSSYNRHPWT